VAEWEQRECLNYYKKVEAARLGCEGDETTEHSSHWNWIIKSGSGLLITRRHQYKEWKQPRFIKNKIESQLLSKRKKRLMKI